MSESGRGARPNTPGAPEYKVLVVEPDADLRTLFALQLDREPTLSVRGSAEALSEGLELAREVSPDIIVFHQPPTDPVSALEAARLLREAVPGCRLVLLSQQEAQLEQARTGVHIDEFVILSPGSIIRGVRRVLEATARESLA